MKFSIKNNTKLLYLGGMDSFKNSSTTVYRLVGLTYWQLEAYSLPSKVGGFHGFAQMPIEYCTEKFFYRNRMTKQILRFGKLIEFFDNETKGKKSISNSFLKERSEGMKVTYDIDIYNYWKLRYQDVLSFEEFIMTFCVNN